MFTRIIIAFFILFVVSFNAVAGENTYTCKIVNVYELGSDGSLISSDLDKKFKGSEFLISRVTGEIIGEVVPNLLTRSSKIMIRNSDELPFKSLTDFDYNPQLVGTNVFDPEKKSFYAISMDGAEFITGLYK